MKVEIYVQSSNVEEKHIRGVVDNLAKCAESLAHLKIGKGPIAKANDLAMRLLAKGVVGSLGVKYNYKEVKESNNATMHVWNMDIPEGLVSDKLELYGNTIKSIGKHVAPHIKPLVDEFYDISVEYEKGDDEIAERYAVKPRFGYIIVERHIDGYIGAQLVKRDSDDTAIMSVGPCGREFFGACNDVDAFDRIIENRIFGDIDDSGIVWFSPAVDETHAFRNMEAVARKRWDNWRVFFIAKVNDNGRDIPVIVAKYPDNTNTLAVCNIPNCSQASRKVEKGKFQIYGASYNSLESAKVALSTLESFMNLKGVDADGK